MAIAVGEVGGECVVQPMADGAQGTPHQFFGGPNQTTTVTGPLGTPVEAEWALRDQVAVIEYGSGIKLAVLAGGADGNDPMD